MSSGQRALAPLWGVWTALVLPAHLRGHRLRRLTTVPDSSDTNGADVAAAYRTGLRFLRLATRLRLAGWRNTCLYRAALECLLLRRAGRPAVVRIGARRGADAIEAHAWVELDGEAIAGSEAAYAPLQRHSVSVG